MKRLSIDSQIKSAYSGYRGQTIRILSAYNGYRGQTIRILSVQHKGSQLRFTYENH